MGDALFHNHLVDLVELIAYIILAPRHRVLVCIICHRSYATEHKRVATVIGVECPGNAVGVLADRADLDTAEIITPTFTIVGLSGFLSRYQQYSIVWDCCKGGFSIAGRILSHAYHQIEVFAVVKGIFPYFGNASRYDD